MAITTARPHGADAAQRRRTMILASVACAGIVVALGLLWWRMGSEPTLTPEQQAAAQQVAERLEQASPPQTPAPAPPTAPPVERGSGRVPRTAGS